jgi:hypothetical protein
VASTRRSRNADIEVIHANLVALVAKENHDDFLSEFLIIYGFSRTAIQRMLDGSDNLSSKQGQYDRRKQFLLEICPTGAVEATFLRIEPEANKNERFVIATDYQKFMAKDMKTREMIDIPFQELPNHAEFFLPWLGVERFDQQVENPADVKAAEKMAVLFDEIRKENSIDTAEERHALNVFLTRLLFCFFADDTGIFESNQFINALIQETASDGHDLAQWFDGLFRVFDIPEDQRTGIPYKYQSFPYVNGGLFKEILPIPKFTFQSRAKLLESGKIDWSAISPDIFGSMFQAVIDPQQRSELGQHYTSVPNIMKVLNPLFLDDLREELEEAKKYEKEKLNGKKLDAFRNKLKHIKVFDPACGSGNFLLIAYKELCHLDMDAILAYDNIQLLLELDIHLNQFYGIEIDDSPCEIARLSLWLAQHQINTECAERGVRAKPTLPLTASGNIIQGNACRLNWEKICPYKKEDLIFVCGNPPYAGHSSKTNLQREDIKFVWGNDIPSIDIDYIACWIKKGCDYIRNNFSKRLSFVTTNSICQGKQAELIWYSVLQNELEIAFAYTSFKWKNNASHKAGVTVIIIGLQNKGASTPKILYTKDKKSIVNQIDQYLRTDNTKSISVAQTQEPPKGLPKMCFGTMPLDGGNLILTTSEKSSLICNYPNATRFIKSLVGSKEFIQGLQRWCLWIDDEKVNDAMKVPFIKQRIEAVTSWRKGSKDPGTQKKAERPWSMREHPSLNKPAIIIPRVSSEDRKYIPIGFLRKETVITDSAFAIYDAPLWLFAILTSEMHMVWIRTVCGRLKTDYRYSATLGYNTFPFPTLDETQKQLLEQSAKTITDIRERHYTMTMAQLYNPETMPSDLKEAHAANDLLVDSLYSKKGFYDDQERLEELFRRYKEMTDKEALHA